MLMSSSFYPILDWCLFSQTHGGIKHKPYKFLVEHNVNNSLICPSMTEKQEAEDLAKAVSDVKIVGAGDKYRSILQEETHNIHWRHGDPPIFDTVNKLFEEERTKEWPKGSLEEAVQNAVKSWEMELSHKTRLQDFKTISPDKFKLFVNGREGLSAEEALKLGSYNALLTSSLPEQFQYNEFRSAFPRGFAWEVISVYSGPPVITYFEGPFKEHAPTGERVEFYGIGIMKVDESMRAEDVEIYYDPGELFAGLLKGQSLSNLKAQKQDSGHGSPHNKSCPFSSQKH